MRVVRILWALVVSAGTLAAAPTAGAAPPPNDGFAQAAPLGDAPFTVAGTVAEATTEPGEPEHGAQTVWYAFRPSRTGRVALEVANAPAMEPRISVYTGSALSALEPATVSRGPLPARVAFDAVAGETYRVAIAHYDCAVSGDGEDRVVECEEGASSFELRGRPAPAPRNDALRDAAPIRIPSEHDGSLADATTEPGEHRRPAHSLWYRFRPQRTGRLTIDFAATGYDCKMRLYTGRSLGGLELVKVGGAPHADASTRPMRLTVRRGVLYRLAVGCLEMERADFVLTLSDGSIEGKGIELAVHRAQTLDTLRTRGLRTTVTSKRRARVSVDLRVSRRTANRLGLGSRVLGRTTGVVDRDTPLRAVVRLSRAVRRALAGIESLRTTVRVQILRSDAPNRVLVKPVTL